MAVIEQELQVEAPAVPKHPVLVEAAEIIRNQGWCQGDFGTRDGPRCIAGAIAQGKGAYHEAIRALADEIGSLPLWNDNPDRTQEEVIELLERVGWGI